MFYRGFGCGCCFGRGYGRGFGFGRGYGLPFHYLDDVRELEFEEKDLEARLDYINRELALNPNDPELNFAKREIENRIDYIKNILSRLGNR